MERRCTLLSHVTDLWGATGLILRSSLFIFLQQWTWRFTPFLVSLYWKFVSLRCLELSNKVRAGVFQTYLILRSILQSRSINLSLREQVSYNFHFFIQRRFYLLDCCRETRILFFRNLVVSGFKAANKLICIKWQPWRAIIVKFNPLLITNCLTKWISDLLSEKDVLTSFTDFILSKEVLTFLISSIPFFFGGF